MDTPVGDRARPDPAGEPASGRGRPAGGPSAGDPGAGPVPGCLVYVTAASEEEARRIGRAVVERRLAACANVVPAIRSYYWWEGRLVEDQESLLLLKTTPSAVSALMEAVRRLHSYQVPAISVVPLSALNPAYLAWMQQEVQPPREGLAPAKGESGHVGAGSAGS